MKQDLTVGELAQATGVTVRTLHHYDALGLLRPAFIGENGYRYYGRNELLRLQQIMLYRELDIPLADIAAALKRGNEDHAAMLTAHRDYIAAEANRYRELLATIDRTISDLRGEKHMKPEDLYKGFSKEKQEGYEGWLIDEYGSDMRERIADSKNAFAKLTDDERQKMMLDLADIEERLVDSMKRGVTPDSDRTALLIARHRQWVARMWARPCDASSYSGLADLYLTHPDFRTRYDALNEGFAEWLAAAMKAHAARQT